MKRIKKGKIKGCSKENSRTKRGDRKRRKEWGRNKTQK